MWLALPLIGLLLVASGTRAFVRARTTAAAWYLMCWCATCIALVCWPSENSMWLDHLAGVVGFGRGIGALFTWIGQVCMFVFTLSFTGRWWRRDSVALMAFSMLLLTEVAAWTVLLPVANSQELFNSVNSGYHGEPSQLLVFNLAYGISAAIGFGLGGSGYLHVRRTARDRHSQVNALAGCLASVIGILYGLSVSVQAVMDHIGFGATGITRLTVLLVLVGMIPTVGVTLAAIYGRPLFFYLRQSLSLGRREHELRRVRRDLLNANVFLSDRLVHLYSHADPRMVQMVADRCSALALPPMHCRVAEEAARWISVNRNNLVLAGPDAASIETRNADIVADAERRAEREHYFYADVFRVVALALGKNRPLDLGLEGSMKTWHRDLARLVRDVVMKPSESAGSLLSEAGALQLCAGCSAGLAPRPTYRLAPLSDQGLHWRKSMERWSQYRARRGTVQS